MVSVEGPEIFLDVNAETGAVLGQGVHDLPQGRGRSAHPITGKLLGRYEEILGHAVGAARLPALLGRRATWRRPRRRGRGRRTARGSRAPASGSAVTPVMDMTGTQADVRRVPFLIAAGLEQIQALPGRRPAGGERRCSPAAACSVEDVLARPERAHARARGTSERGRLGRARCCSTGAGRSTSTSPASRPSPAPRLFSRRLPAGLDQRRRGAAVPLGAPAGRLSLGRLCYAVCFMVRRRMKRAGTSSDSSLAMLAVSGCNGYTPDRWHARHPGAPTVNLKSAETRWLLIKNPRFGDVRSEPEYIWVEEDKLPTTMTTLLRGKSAIIAPPEVVAKYGLPPGGGKISPRQGVPYQTVDPSRAGASIPGSRAAPRRLQRSPQLQPRRRSLRLRRPRRPHSLRRRQPAAAAQPAPAASGQAGRVPSRRRLT